MRWRLGTRSVDGQNNNFMQKKATVVVSSFVVTESRFDDIFEGLPKRTKLRKGNIT